MLKIKNLDVFYGNIQALRGIEFEVNEGEIVTLIGANGAGKTTTLHAISGLIPVAEGTIEFMGEIINDIPAHKRVAQGLVQVPEGRRIFSKLSVMDNLDLGAYTRRDKKGIQKDKEKIFSRFPRLWERKNQQAGTLSGGEQQMLAMGRSLMSKPKVLLMDEPSMGLAPLLVKEIFSIIRDINAEGTTILLVEQNANMALSVADRAYVLETGRVVLHGDADELKKSEEIRKAYLGV